MRLESLGFWCLVGLVVLAPIPFGGIEAWSWSLLGTAVGVLLVVWAAGLAVSGRAAPAGLGRLWPLVLPFALVAVWIALQSETGIAAGWHHPLWKTAAEVLGLPVASSVSLDRYETGAALLRLLAYAGIFWLALQHGRDVRRARQVMQAVVVAGVVYAAYGLAVEFSGAQKILWYDKVRYVDSLTATFWYKNAYATYAGLGLVAALGLFVAAIGETTGAGFGRRETAAMLVNRLLARDWILLVALVVLPTALVLSDSRAGFLATSFGLLVLLVAARLGERRAARGTVAVGGAIALAMAVVLAVSGGTVVDRIGDAAEDIADKATVRDDRPVVYALTLEAIADAPLTGTGYGTYAEAFRFYRVPELHRHVRAAHNTYLDNALELGVPAAAVLTATAAGVFVLAVIGLFRRRRDVLYPAIGVAATALVGVHALIDFTMQVPAVAATWALIAGAACGQAWSRIETGRARSGAREGGAARIALRDEA